jgi:hypothetical protein
LLRQLGALLEAWVNVGVYEAVGAALDAELGDRETRDAQVRLFVVCLFACLLVCRRGSGQEKLTAFFFMGTKMWRK